MKLHYLIIIDAIYVTEVSFVSLYINYHGLFSLFSSWSIWYMDIIWIWHLSCGILSCCIALTYGVMSRTYGSDLTGTASFIEHNDVGSYLDGYEGRSSYASICMQHHWFDIMLQLHIFMGMKAGVHVH